MVGTLEPRKGYLQALDAFERLWEQGVEVNLVIVGREGWKGRLQKECRETELQEAVKRMPLTPTVTENKLMYQVLAHPENTAMMQLVHFLLWANSKRQR